MKPGQAAPVPAERQAAAEKPTPAATPAATRAAAAEQPLGAAEKQPEAAARGAITSGPTHGVDEPNLVGNENV